MTATATAENENGTSLINVSGMFPTAEVRGTTRAYVIQGVDLSAGSLAVSAGSAGAPVQYAATATSVVASGDSSATIISGALVKADAKISGLVESFAGAPMDLSGTPPSTALNVSGALAVFTFAGIGFSDIGFAGALLVLGLDGGEAIPLALAARMLLLALGAGLPLVLDLALAGATRMAGVSAISQNG